jgi:hypothetical protein
MKIIGVRRRAREEIKAACRAVLAMSPQSVRAEDRLFAKYTLELLETPISDDELKLMFARPAKASG